MSRAFEVFQKDEGSRVELYEAGELIAKGPARIGLREYLIRAIQDETPVLASMDGYMMTGDGVHVRLPAGTGPDPRFVPGAAEMTTDRTFTVSEVVDLVEALKQMAYNQTKARVGTLLEALLGVNRLTGTPVGRLFEYTLDDLQRALDQCVEIRAPEVAEMMPKHVVGYTSLSIGSVELGNVQAPITGVFAKIGQQILQTK